MPFRRAILKDVEHVPGLDAELLRVARDVGEVCSDVGCISEGVGDGADAGGAHGPIRLLSNRAH